MKPEFALDWQPVSVPASQLLSLLSAKRGQKLDIEFFYGEDVYRIGNRPENLREPFYFDEEGYPSLFVLRSTACLEGGFLLPDLERPLYILRVNGEDPADWFKASANE